MGGSGNQTKVALKDLTRNSIDLPPRSIFIQEGNKSQQGVTPILKKTLLGWLISLPFWVATTAISATDPLCGSSEPIACSAYEVLGSVRDPARAFYSDKFHAACAEHDYCYRYGYATYGRSKDDCDKQFLSDMQKICLQFDWRTIVTPGYNLGECQVVAGAFYAAVHESPLAAKAYQQGTLTCSYEGFCPSGKFETIGKYHDCTCPVGEKRFTGILNETAYCTGAVDCPRGRFATTGEYRGCSCPQGSKQDLDPASAYAYCSGYRNNCPNDTFSTMGAYYDCSCPDGSRKEHLDPAKIKATCTKACPSDTFSTMGTYHNCGCPDGSRKVYLDPAKIKATCTKTCPSGEFKTIGKYKGCSCPEGKKKDYLDVFKYKARCK